MGYSGYTQYLCGKGHSDSRDCMDETLKECIHCDSRMVWRNGVATTNGSHCQMKTLNLTTDDWDALALLSTEESNKRTICNGCEHCDSGRIDGYVELEEVQARQTEVCPCCEHIKELEPARFKIPMDKGRKV